MPRMLVVLSAATRGGRPRLTFGTWDGVGEPELLEAMVSTPEEVESVSQMLENVAARYGLRHADGGAGSQ